MSELPRIDFARVRPVQFASPIGRKVAQAAANVRPAPVPFKPSKRIAAAMAAELNRYRNF